MKLQLSIYAVVIIDIILSGTLGFCYRTGDRKYIWKNVSNLGYFRALCGIATLGLALLVDRYPVSAMRSLYFYSYYVLYLGLTALAFKLYFEIFRKATVAFPGFSRWGSSILAWIIVVIVAIAMMNLGSANSGQDPVARGAINMVRAIETVSLCVVAMLFYLVRSMGLSWRSKVYGIMTGFLLASLGGVIQTAQYQFHLESNVILIAFYQYAGIISLIIWIGYAFLPEPLPRPVTVPADSPVYRWSQIAAALGAKTQVAMPEPQHSFFLADVEKVVDKVFTRHMQETPESNG